MKNSSIKDGSMMLLVVVLMSIVLVLCTRMWRSTAYVVDIALQKQLYMQKKWAVQGVLNCALQACNADFDAVYLYVIAQGGSVTMPIPSFHIVLPHVAQYVPVVTFAVHTAQKIHITGELFEGKTSVIAVSTDICRTSVVA